MSANTNTIQYILAVETAQVKSDLQKAEASAMRLADYLSAISGNPDIDYILGRLQKAMTMARSLQTLITTINIGRAIAGDPFAIASLATQAGATAFSFFDLTAGY